MNHREIEIEHLARDILQADANLGDDGLYQVVPDPDGGTTAVRIDDHMLALRAYARALEIALLDSIRVR